MFGRTLAVVVVALLFHCDAFAQDNLPKTPADLQIVVKMETAKSLMASDEQYPVIVSELEPVAADGELYRRLSPAYRHDLDVMLGFAAFRLQRPSLAHAAYVRASSSPPATYDDWVWRMETAKLDADFDDAYLAFKTLRARVPGFEQGLDDRTVSVLDQGFGRLKDASAQPDWESYLAAQGWRPHDPLFSPDVIRLHYAISLLGSGHSDEAARLADTFTEPIVLAVIGADRRFDAITAGDPSHWDGAAAAQRRLLSFQSQARAHPQSLAWQSAVASQLYGLGRSVEALAVVQKALATAQQTSATERVVSPGFSGDYDHALGQKSFFLFSLGRYDEALGVAAGVGACGPCGPNTDTALLQAHWLVDLGRGREALDQLAPVSMSNLTLPSRMTLAQLRACAAGQTGEADIRLEAMRYLEGHGSDDPSRLIRAQLCFADTAAAASTVRASLADPRQRHIVLAELQLYLPDGVLTPLQVATEDRLQQVRDNAEVRAAVAIYGRIRRQAIRKDELY